jgi:hypothetical protein
MRWLIFVFFVSLGALLFVAAALARHVFQCAKLRRKPVASAGRAPGPHEEADQDLEP